MSGVLRDLVEDEDRELQGYRYYKMVEEEKPFQFRLTMDDSNPYVKLNDLCESETFIVSFDAGKMFLTAFPFKHNTIQRADISKKCLEKSGLVPYVYDYETYYDLKEGYTGIRTYVDLWPTDDLEGRKDFSSDERELLISKMEEAIDNVLIDCFLIRSIGDKLEENNII